MNQPSEGARSAVLVDFGGVLTTSLLESFTAFGATLGTDPGLPLKLLATDPESRTLLADHECGRISAEEFCAGFAGRLAAHGATVEAAGLDTRLMEGMGIDAEMMTLIASLRTAGYPVAIVSNSFGSDPYRGLDLGPLADEVVISGKVGVRKPSRKIFALACERLGVAPETAVMIDDLQPNLDGAARLGIAGVLHTDAENTAKQLAERFGIQP